MGLREQDGLSYRTPVTAAAPRHSVSSTDEQQHSTLTEVRNLFADAVTGLDKDFSTFDILGAGTDEAVKDRMMRQIAGNQIAYSILTPLLDALDSAVKKVDNKYKEK